MECWPSLETAAPSFNHFLSHLIVFLSSIRIEFRSSLSPSSNLSYVAPLGHSGWKMTNLGSKLISGFVWKKSKGQFPGCTSICKYLPDYHGTTAKHQRGSTLLGTLTISTIQQFLTYVKTQTKMPEPFSWLIARAKPPGRFQGPWCLLLPPDGNLTPRVPKAPFQERPWVPDPNRMIIMNGTLR